MQVPILIILFIKCNSMSPIDLPWQDYFLIPISALFLVLFAGLMSGLTVGMMAIDPMSLTVKLDSGTLVEKKQASRILPLISDHHLLLVTLLLGNAIALETLPVILDWMMTGPEAVISSVLLTLFIGEVIPQAICLGPKQIPVASFFAPFVQLIIWLLWPISYPIARLLDKVIGHSHIKLLNNAEMKTLFRIMLDKPENSLTEAQISIIHKTIDRQEHTVGDKCVLKDRVFAVPADMILSEENLEFIAGKGFSRVPVKNNAGDWIGVLMTKQLIGIDARMTVSDLEIKSAFWVGPQISIFEVMEEFLTGKTHMAFVKDFGNKALGIITLTDVLREITRHERVDRHTYSVTVSENGTSDRKNTILRKVVSVFKRKRSVDKELVEFQMAEKSTIEV
jgi:metal transporter CNNM